MLMRSGREIPLFGSRLKLGAVDADDDAAPGPVALRVTRGVAEGVLTRQLVGDLTVDFRQIAHLTREERPSARFLGELAQRKFSFLEPFALGCVAGTQADWISGRLGPFRDVQYLL